MRHLYQVKLEGDKECNHDCQRVPAVILEDKVSVLLPSLVHNHLLMGKSI